VREREAIKVTCEKEGMDDEGPGHNILPTYGLLCKVDLQMNPVT
jgi:hypothetical protein